MPTRTRFPVLDGHNDVLLRLYVAGREQEHTFFERNDHGHLDLPRMQEGGFAGGFFAVYVPAPPGSKDDNEGGLPPPLEPDYAQRSTIAMSALLFRLEQASQGQLKVVRNATELERCIENGVVAAILHFEGAEAIDTNLDALEVFYRAGLRSLGLVWSRPNAFGHGVPFITPHSPDTGPGLTDAGKDLVRACNRLGILVDLSHLNEQGFWDVARLSDAPLVASHSNAHALCRMTRNLTDHQLDAIRETEGMVGVNFGCGFLLEEGRGNPQVSLDEVVRHVDYLVKRMGIDCVGFGSDFDGTTVPEGIGDAAGLPNLLDALRSHGYDEPSLRKITHQNWVRVLRQTWGTSSR